MENAPVQNPTNGSGIKGSLAPATPIPLNPAFTFQIAKLEYEAKLLDYHVRMSDHLAKSDMIPEQYRGKPANIVVATQYGLTLGLSISQSLQNIHVITGKPTLSSAAVMGIVLPHADEPPSVEHERDSSGCCTAVTTTYKRKGKLFGKRFSLEDAERAKLLGNTGWRHYPENMLELRSGVFAARKAFPDILSGIYSTEEIEQEPALPPEGGGRFSDETGSLSESTKAVEPIPSSTSTQTDDDPGEVEEYAKARQTLELSDSLEELQSTWIAGQRSWNEDFDEQSMKILTAIKDMRKQSLQNASSKEDE